MYIGPQGIVHGTFNTLINAGRLKLGVPEDGDLKGKIFVTSGLGGMSGAQPKAIEIANGVGIDVYKRQGLHLFQLRVCALVYIWLYFSLY